MSDTIQNFARKGQTLLLFVVSLGIALHLDANAADPLAPKTFWLALGAAGLASLGLARFWWGAKLAYPTGDMAKSLAGLLVALTLSFLFSSSKVLSETAWNGWLLAGLLFVSALDWFGQDGKSVSRFLEAGLLSLVVCIVWQGMQYLGKDPSAWASAYSEQFSGRMAAGSGNPNFLAGLLVLLAPLGIARFWNTRWRWQAGLAVLGLGMVAALFTGSKAAVIAVSFQMFCLGHLLWHSDFDRSLRIKMVKIWSGALASGALLVMFIPSTRSRLWDLVTLQSDSIYFRVHTWGGAIAIWFDNLIFGSGPGTFFAFYPSHKSGEAMKLASQHSYEVTHAENWILQILSDGGLVGLLAFGWFAWVLGKAIWLRAHQLADKEKSESGLALALCLALGGSLVLNLFALDLFLPQTFWFFALACAAGAARFASPLKAIGLKPEPYASILVSVVLVFLSSFIGAQAGGRWIASKDLETGKRIARSGDFEKAIPYLTNSKALDPANPESRYFLASAYMDKKQYKESEEEFRELMEFAPDYILLHHKVGSLYLQQDRNQEAINSFKRQVQLDPWFLPANQGLLTAMYRNKDMQLEETMDAVLGRFPNNASLWRNRAALSHSKSDLEATVKALEKVLQLDPENTEDKKNLEQLRKQLKNQPKKKLAE